MSPESPETKIDQDRAQAAVTALQTKGVRLPCPRCGTNKFSFGGESVVSIQTNPNVLNIGGPAIPTFIVICDNCGYLTQHAQAVLGLMRK